MGGLLFVTSSTVLPMFVFPIPSTGHATNMRPGEGVRIQSGKQS